MMNMTADTKRHALIRNSFQIAINELGDSFGYLTFGLDGHSRWQDIFTQVDVLRTQIYIDLKYKDEVIVDRETFRAGESKGMSCLKFSYQVSESNLESFDIIYLDTPKDFRELGFNTILTVILCKMAIKLKIVVTAEAFNIIPAHTFCKLGFVITEVMPEEVNDDAEEVEEDNETKENSTDIRKRFQTCEEVSEEIRGKIQNADDWSVRFRMSRKPV